LQTVRPGQRCALTGRVLSRAGWCHRSPSPAVSVCRFRPLTLRSEPPALAGGQGRVESGCAAVLG
jgi:hypothetical protein